MVKVNPRLLPPSQLLQEKAKANSKKQKRYMDSISGSQPGSVGIVDPKFDKNPKFDKTHHGAV